MITKEKHRIRCFSFVIMPDGAGLTAQGPAAS
jgi:hypothetical protein